MQQVTRELYEYALKTLAPHMDPEQALQRMEHMVVRVPATCFNEQKLEEHDQYQVHAKNQLRL